MKFDMLDPVFHSYDKTDLRYWKGEPIIPLDEWIKYSDIHYARNYLHDDFDESTYIPENELEGKRNREGLVEG
jgi:hypothetical protein